MGIFGRNRGILLQKGPKKVALTGEWPYLADGRNRGKLITEFKKEKDRGFFFGLNWRMAVIEVDVIEGFYCIRITRKMPLITSSP